MISYIADILVMNVINYINILFYYALLELPSSIKPLSYLKQNMYK